MRNLSIYVRSATVFLGLTLLLNVASDAMGYRWLNWRSDDLKGFSILPVYLRFSEEPDIVCLGTSHSRAGIIPLRMQQQFMKATGGEVEVWNLGIPGGNLRQIPQLLDVVFAEGKSPSVLLVESTAIYWRHQPKWEVFNQAFEDVVGGDGSDPDEGLIEAATRWVENNFYGPASTWRQAQRLISKQARDRASIPRDHGSRWTMSALAADLAEPGPYNPELLERERSEPAAARPGVDALQASDERDTIFDTLDARCAAEGCRLVLWRPPATVEYQNLLPEGFDEGHLAWLTGRASTAGATVLDLDTPENRVDAMFRDIDHLDPSGADEVGRQLVQQLAPILDSIERAPSD